MEIFLEEGECLINDIVVSGVLYEKDGERHYSDSSWIEISTRVDEEHPIFLGPENSFSLAFENLKKRPLYQIDVLVFFQYYRAQVLHIVVEDKKKRKDGD